MSVNKSQSRPTVNTISTEFFRPTSSLYCFMLLLLLLLFLCRRIILYVEEVSRQRAPCISLRPQQVGHHCAVSTHGLQVGGARCRSDFANAYLKSLNHCYNIAMFFFFPLPFYAFNPKRYQFTRVYDDFRFTHVFDVFYRSTATERQSNGCKRNPRCCYRHIPEERIQSVARDARRNHTYL